MVTDNVIAITHPVIDEHGSEHALDGLERRVVHRQTLDTLNTSPHRLTPTPPENEAQVFLGATLHKVSGATAYNDVNLKIAYRGDNGVEVGEVDGTGFLNTMASRTREVRPHKAASGDSSKNVTFGVPLELKVDTAITDGEGGIIIHTYYRKIRRP